METITRTGARTAHRTPLVEIKQMLGACFPGIQFRYYSEHRQGCCSIRIMYTDGAAQRRVKHLLREFNREVFPEVSASRVEVIVQRQMSAQTRDLLLREIKSIFRFDRLPQENDSSDLIGGTVGEYMEKIFRLRDF